MLFRGGSVRAAPFLGHLEAERITYFGGQVGVVRLEASSLVDVQEVPVLNQNKLPAGNRDPAHDAVNAKTGRYVVILNKVLPVPG